MEVTACLGDCIWSLNYNEMPLSMDDCKLIKEAITLLDNKDNLDTARAKKVLAKVRTRLTSILNFV